MKTPRMWCVLVLAVAMGAIGLAQPIREEEYAARRHLLLAKLDSNAIMILRGAEAKVFSNDVDFRFRQESNFLYLTGSQEPAATLIMSAKAFPFNGRQVRAVYVGKMIEPGTFAGSGEATSDPSHLAEVITAATSGITTAYISMPDLRFINDWLNNRPLFLDRDVRKEFEQKHPGVKVKNAAPLLTDQRLIKSAAELALIRKAIDVTGRGIERALQECYAGIPEYALQAAVEYEMVKGGAYTQSYPSIVGSGTNSLILHYDDNRRMTKAGEIIVMDVGAEYEGYAADVTRTIPVSGTYTAAQKKVYTVVHTAQDEIFKKVRPGLLWRDIDATATDVITKAGYGRFIKHGVTHFVGLDVHDAGLADTLKAGMVLTVEPGIYIPEGDTTVSSDFRGWGVRIEDDVLVTETGCEVLTKSIPREISDIERVMRKK